MLLRRSNETPQEVKQLQYGPVQGFQIGREQILEWFGSGEKRGITSADGKEENTKLII